MVHNLHVVRRRTNHLHVVCKPPPPCATRTVPAEVSIPYQQWETKTKPATPPPPLTLSKDETESSVNVNQSSTVFTAVQCSSISNGISLTVGI